MNRRRILTSLGSHTPTAKDYVQDGLVAMWDAMFLTPTNSRWAATIGDNLDWELTGVGIDTDGSLMFAGSAESYGELTSEQSEIFENVGTLEIVLKPTPVNLTDRWGTILKTQQNCLVGLAIYNTLTPTLTGSNNITGPVSVIPNTLAGKWFSVSITYNNEVEGYFVNAIYNQFATGKDSIGSTQNVTRIGSRMTTYPFRGNIFAIRYYSRVLTVDEIAANYAIDKARFGLT